MATDNEKKQEDFIFDIDDTIDNLFQPSRKIEIDPLTQEIKTISDDTDESDATLSSDLEKKPEEVKKEDSQEEIGMEPPEYFKEEFKEEPSPVREHIDRIHQQLLTIEWEVSGPEMDKALELISTLSQYEEIKSNSHISGLVDLMKQLMDLMSESPETASTKIPSILQDGVKVLKDFYHPSSPLSEKEFQERFNELSNEFLKIKEESRDTVAAVHEEPEEILELELEEPETLEEEPDEEVVQEPEPVEDVRDLEAAVDQVETAREPEQVIEKEGDETEPVEIEKITEVSEEKKVEDRALSTAPDLVQPAVVEERPVEAEPVSGELNDVVLKHIGVLEKCIEKIKPVEKLLAETKGMEKLYNFQSRIRNILEAQKELLESSTGKQTEKGDEPVGEVDISGGSCPWSTLAAVSWDGQKIYVPGEEVACATQLPFFNRGKLKNLSEFSLSLYKSMPWSKISSCVGGKLKDQDEKTLSSIKVPFMAGRDFKRNSVILLLHNGKTGVALPVLQKPEYVDTEEMSVVKKTGGTWQHCLVEDKEGNMIPVATINSFLNS